MPAYNNFIKLFSFGNAPLDWLTGGEPIALVVYSHVIWVLEVNRQVRPFTTPRVDNNGI